MNPQHYRQIGFGLLLAMTYVCLSGACAGPVLTSGVWKNITPPDGAMTPDNHVFCQGMAIDPAHPATLYLGVCAYDVSKGGHTLRWRIPISRSQRRQRPKLAAAQERTGI